MGGLGRSTTAAFATTRLRHAQADSETVAEFLSRTGYDIETAVADIIDNSVDAGERRPAAGHYIEIQHRTDCQLGGDRRSAVEGQGRAMPRKFEHTDAVDCQAQATFQHRQYAVHAREAGERPVLPDLGHADTPGEVVEARARRPGRDLARNAAAVLPGDRLAIRRAKDGERHPRMPGRSSCFSRATWSAMS